MDHSVFIWCAYGASALILTWTALSPLFRQRRAAREVQHHHEVNKAVETSHDTDA